MPLVFLANADSQVTRIELFFILIFFFFCFDLSHLYRRRSLFSITFPPWIVFAEVLSALGHYISYRDTSIHPRSNVPSMNNGRCLSHWLRVFPARIVKSVLLTPRRVTAPQRLLRDHFICKFFECSPYLLYYQNKTLIQSVISQQRYFHARKFTTVTQFLVYVCKLQRYVGHFDRKSEIFMAKIWHFWKNSPANCLQRRWASLPDLSAAASQNEAQCSN